MPRQLRNLPPMRNRNRERLCRQVESSDDFFLRMLAHERQAIVRRVDEPDASLLQGRVLTAPGEKAAVAVQARLGGFLLHVHGTLAVCIGNRQPGSRARKTGELAVRAPGHRCATTVATLD